MAITEEDRYELFKSLEEVLGRDRASTLMEHLPPVGWADVATKRDLEQLEFRVDARFDQMEASVDARFNQMEASVDARFNQMEARFDARFERIDGRFEQADGRLDQVANQLRAEFRLDTRNIVFAMVASNATFAALVIAATRLG